MLQRTPATAASDRWKDPASIIVRSLDTGIEPPEVEWGLVALVPMCFGRGPESPFSGEQNALDQADRVGVTESDLRRSLEALWRRGLAKLRNGEPACALLALVARNSVFQSYTFGAGAAGSLQDVRQHVESLYADLWTVDAAWKPGRCPSIGMVVNSAARRVVVAHPLNAFEGVYLALRNARSACVHVLKEDASAWESLAGIELANTSFDLAHSAWKLAHSLRRMAERNGGQGVAVLQRLQRNEHQALFRTVESAAHSGKYLTSAALASMLLRQVPNVLPEGIPQNVGDMMQFRILQAGFELDSRHNRRPKRKKEHPVPRDLEPMSAALEATEAGGRAIPADPTAYEPTSETTMGAGAFSATDGSLTPRAIRPPGKSVWRKRLLYDIRTNPRWRSLISWRGEGEVASDPSRLLFEVLEAAREGRLTSMSSNGRETLEDAVHLACDYGLLEYAANLLRMIREPSVNVVVGFGIAAKEAFKQHPFGLDLRRSVGTLEALRFAWSRVPVVSPLHLYERWTLHEVLLARIGQSVQFAHDAAARLLVRRLYEGLSEGERRIEIRETKAARAFGPGIVPLGSLLKSIKESTRARAEAAPAGFANSAFVSVVGIANDRWSVIIVGRDGRPVASEWHTGDLPAAANAVRRTGAAWFARARAGTLPVPWGTVLTDFARRLLDTVGATDGAPTWVCLALDPLLGGLPWQDLFARIGQGQLVVSFVPNLGWIHGNAESAVSIPTAPWIVVDSSSPDLAVLASEIRNDRDRLADLFLDVAVVMGHGHQEGETVAGFELSGNSMDFNQWLGVLQREVCVIHACHGGYVKRSFLADVGGLPGLALSYGCQAFLAPVTAVPLETAQRLHRELVSSGPAEIGLRYLNAVRKDPAVALYTLYGRADMRAIPRRPDRV